MVVVLHWKAEWHPLDLRQWHCALEGGPTSVKLKAMRPESSNSDQATKFISLHAFNYLTKYTSVTYIFVMVSENYSYHTTAVMRKCDRMEYVRLRWKPWSFSARTDFETCLFQRPPPPPSSNPQFCAPGRACYSNRNLKISSTCKVFWIKVDAKWM